MVRKHDEDDHQAALFKWAQYHKHDGEPISRLMFHIPNGGRRDKAEGKRLKAQGVRAGVSDVFLHVPAGRYHGMFLELKVDKNKPTAEQLDFFGSVARWGYAYGVAYGWEQAKDKILCYLQGKYLNPDVLSDLENGK